MKRNSRMLAFALLVVMMLALVGGVVTAQDAPKTVVSGLVMTSGDLSGIDPTISEVSSSIEVVNQMFIGLTAQDVTTAETVPGLASSWTVEPTDDGNVAYTFTLMEGVPWVRYNVDTGEVEQLLDENGNVRTVVAQDFVNGIIRALDPVTAAPYSYVPIPYIVGAAEFNNGEAGPEAVQVSAPDASTVVIVAPEEVAFAPAIYGLWVLRAIPDWVIADAGNSWTDPENIATYGPYAAMEWAHDESFTMIKNPFWPGTEYIPQPAIDQVVLRFLDAEQQLPEYQAGTMDAITLPAADIPRIQADPSLSAEYVTGANPCTYYYGFNNEEAPFSSANLRRAFSQAIDRVAIVENVTRGGQTAAQWFAYPGLNASPTMELNADVGVTYDPAGAQESLAAALTDLGYSSVDELNAIGITLTYNDTPTHAAIAQVVQQMWKDTLGVDVTLSAQESTGYFSRLSEQYPQIARAGWCQDYSDANNFLYDVFYSQSSQNDPGFNNAEFDALVEQARTETDNDVRRDLYAQAENIFSLQEAGIAPIYWYANNFLVKPYVERANSITGNEAYYLWDINN